MAQAGSTCDDPLVVTSMPFTDSGNTATYGNNYSSSDMPPLAPDAVTNGSSSYLGGDDVVYSYTAGSNGFLNVNASGVGSWVGMYVFTGCNPFVSAVGTHTSSASGTRSIPNIPVLAGETYYIIISTWPTPNSTDYTLTLDGPNVAAPASCPRPIALTATNASTNSADINWTENGTATSWDIEYGEAGFTQGTGTMILGHSSTTYSLTGLNPSTQYTAYVRAVCDTDDSSFWSGPISFTTTQIPATLPYADDFSTNQFTFVNGTETNKWAYGAAAGNSGNSMYISNDDGVTNAYTTNSSNVVQAYRDIAIPAGATSAEFSFDWRAKGEGFSTFKYDYFKVWLVPADYIPTAGTQISAGTGRIQVGSEFNDSETWQTFFENQLDISTFAGQTMRLVFKWRNDSSGGTQPPAAIDNISLEIPACPAPMDLATTNVNSDSVDISWTAGDSETAWNVSWGAPGYTPGVDDLGTDTASTTSYQIAGLTPQTSYDVYVQADCGNGDLSSWAGPLSFETACSAITEMFEDFDSYATGSIVPDCWERIVPATSAGSQTISSTSPDSGTRNIYQYTSSTSNSVIVALPEFSNVNAGTHWLKLKARVASGSGALSVGYVTDVSDYNSFTLIEDVTITNTSYASNSEYTVVIPNTVPAGARLGIKSAANGTSHYWDDVTWEQAPSCLEPSSLEVTDLTSTTADIAWVANNSETSWNVSWGAPGYTPGDTEEISTAVASTNSYQIGVLSADSYYDVYVQANCGAVDGESTWAGPLSVYTGYCIPSGSSNNDDEIRNFTLNNLNNDSAASEGVNGYSDYTTSVAPAELQAGVPYIASLTSGTGSGNHGAAIWIDLDQNLVFDSSEMVAFLPNSIGANTTIDFPAFTLPSNLPLGTYRLRVQYHYNKSGDLLDPCVATSSFSETEDYTVEVSEATVSVDDYNMFSDTRLYPNPLNDNTFFVHAPKLNGEQVEVNITDMTGRQFYNNTFSVSDNRLTVSLNESLTSGVYLVTLKNGGDAHTFRLVKK